MGCIYDLKFGVPTLGESGICGLREVGNTGLREEGDEVIH